MRNLVCISCLGFFVVPVFVFFFVIDDGVMLVFYVFDGSRCGVGGWQISWLLLKRNYVRRVVPINRNFSGPAQQVRLMVPRLIGNYPDREFNHYHVFSNISETCDSSWKFGESQLIPHWRTFKKKGNVLPGCQMDIFADCTGTGTARCKSGSSSRCSQPPQRSRSRQLLQPRFSWTFPPWWPRLVSPIPTPFPAVCWPVCYLW